MKTLNVIYICRVGIAVLAALVASFTVDLKVGDPLLNGISISLAIYILSYYVLKYFFMNKVDKPTKIFTMGIGGYFLTFLLCWVLFITPTLAIPQAQFTVDDYNPEVGQTITFDARMSTDSDGEIVRYSWNFGDEKTSEGMTTTHSYSAPDEYIVILTVVDDNGLTHSNSTTITVRP
ncbi:MAG: PKD domain-containing protein [Candidatus Bathyarchaeota archaeon]|nr:PKD domain-containing protein [Candidatus Bathyarchaeum tardum]WGM89038.1 MAG: PKD domain-containing protein [Candidatus Bathyarchaeum tardum]WNZ28724.1 MAG: PKD domain-containing protein [Candidatus Bathyarchaeota archaeon]